MQAFSWQGAFATDILLQSRAGLSSPNNAMARWHTFIHTYAWFLAKNLLGWLLILASFLIGPAVPGPGGIPLFLIGFALVTFPGKRRFTARVLRGRQLSPTSRLYRVLTWAISFLIAGLVLVFSELSGVEGFIYRHNRQPAPTRAIASALAMVLTFAILRLTPLAINLILRIMPRVRRKIRPVLRRMGIRLLPPRWLRHSEGKLAGRIRQAEEEIVLFTEKWKEKTGDAWRKIRPYLPKMIGIIVVPLIFYRLFKPIVLQWDDIKPHLAEIRWELLALACLMFSLNQGFCRLTSWRGVLHGLGWRMPLKGGARVWAMSELARYVPGLVWQVVGRAFLAKPYGLPMTTSSVSQVLELTIYLLANVIVAASTLSLVSAQIANEQTRLALRLATLLVPILLAFVHPRVFYPVVNAVLRKLKKPLIEKRLSFRRLIGLLALCVAGQAWLGLAIWLATASILQVPVIDFWLLSGAYCLAWTAGFCMSPIAPGGVGIRELVLSGTLVLLVGSRIGAELDPAARMAIFAAIALLLRLWATTGELIFATAAYAWDFRAARGLITEQVQRVEPDEVASAAN